MSTEYQKHFMQIAWTGAGAPSDACISLCSTLRATHRLVPPMPPVSNMCRESWSRARTVGQLRVLHACHALTSWAAALPESSCPPWYSQSLASCKLIAPSYFSGNRPGESSQESGLYLSQQALALKSQGFSACQKKQTKALSLTRALYKLQKLFHFIFAHEESCIVEQGGDNQCQKLFKSYFESIFHLQNLSGLSNFWQLKSAFLILVYGVPQSVTKNCSVLGTSEQPVCSQDHWEHVCHDMSQSHGGHRGAGTAWLILLSLGIKSKPGSTVAGEADALLQRLCDCSTELPASLAVCSGQKK